MLRQFQKYIKQQDLFSVDDKLLVALSGGADSVALLDLLLRGGYSVIAVHCNFHLRGQESERDEEFVRELCQKMNVELYVQHFDTIAYSRSKGISIEMAARELRYEWFESLRKEKECSFIAIAHHQNDQAETVLLNLKRGTGLRGLGGMKNQNGCIVRPLLFAQRADILAYLQIRGLSHVEDSTNSDEAYKRNAIRKQLKSYSNAEVEHIAVTAQYVQGYVRLIDDYINKLRQEIITEHDQKIYIDIQRLMQTPSPSVVLYEMLKDYGFTQIDEIYQSLNRISGKRFYADKYVALKDRDCLIIYPKEADKLREYKIKQTVRQKNESEVFPLPNELKILLDADRLSNLSIRNWREGDYFYPIGLRGKKKVSDFLTNIHLSLEEKGRVRVMLSGEDIVWIIGYRIDDRFKITSQTTKVAEIELL